MRVVIHRRVFLHWRDIRANVSVRVVKHDKCFAVSARSLHFGRADALGSLAVGECILSLTLPPLPSRGLLQAGRNAIRTGAAYGRQTDASGAFRDERHE